MLLLAALLLCMAGLAGAAERLTISYFERPPYYYTSATGQPGGLLLDRTRQLIEAAGVDAEYISLTPYRIMYILRHGTFPNCSIGWFKNPEREAFAKFSLPIHRDRPLVLLTSQAQQQGFRPLSTLRQVFRDPQLVMARIGEFSYGDYVDGLLTELTPKSLFFTGQQSALLQAVVDRRAAYMLVAPEEIPMLAEAAGVPTAGLVTFALKDIPAGNIRYLMCSQEVADETLARLNRAIASLYPELATLQEAPPATPSEQKGDPAKAASPYTAE